jgi:hypothetical protein
MIARCACPPLRLVILSTAAYSCGTAWAASGAHEHGAAELFLSSEGKDVAITFNLPAHSAVGFETTAVSEEQKAAVEQAQKMLMVPDDLFVLEGNTCEVTDVVIDVSSVVDVSKRQSQQKEHANHTKTHADHIDESAQAADGHDHEHHGRDDEDDAPAPDSHSDLSAAYAFKCDSDEALTQITFSPEGLPFGLERIDVFWVADWGQGAGQATRQVPQVTLRN